VTRINDLGRFSEHLEQFCRESHVQRLGRLLDPELCVRDDRLDGPMTW
jgi:hypothetical protein